jgi:sugar O-acyltransferase (sialic acid O-acetyltransferase NeuD family)
MDPTERVVIIGAGGHGQEVADIVRHQSHDGAARIPLGFIVDREYLTPEINYELPVLGDWSWFENVDRGQISVICAVGDPVLRKRWVQRAMSLGLRFTKVISPSAFVAPTAVLGEGVMIFPFSMISTNVAVGNHSIINTGSNISHDGSIDDFVTIGPGVHIAGNVSIGEGCYLGIGANVIEQVSIGSWTTVGAGAAVIHNLPEAVTAVGVPARPIKTRAHS